MESCVPKDANAEKRSAQRHKLSLPMRIVAVGGDAVDWIGETRDIGAGGVRFVMPFQLLAGTRVEYIVTLSSYHPAAEIRCAGSILRCAKRGAGRNGESWEAAVTMDRYRFGAQSESPTAAE